MYIFDRLFILNYILKIIPIYKISNILNTVWQLNFQTEQFKSCWCLYLSFH
jgi:hypothetical protein